MTDARHDLEGSLAAFTEQRKGLAEALDMLVEANREFTDFTADAIGQPGALDAMRKAARRQTEKLGTAVERFEDLLARQEEILHAVGRTIGAQSER